MHLRNHSLKAGEHNRQETAVIFFFFALFLKLNKLIHQIYQQNIICSRCPGLLDLLFCWQKTTFETLYPSVLDVGECVNPCIWVWVNECVRVPVCMYGRH